MNEVNQDTESAVYFDDVASLITALGAYTSPAELHGVLCSQLVGQPRFSETAWMQIAAVYLEREDIGSQAAIEALQELYARAKKQLAGVGFEFDLLLPEESEALSVRLEALARWCGAFVNGFDKKLEENLSDEALESLADLAQIAQVDRDPSQFEIPADAERDITALREYVRMAVIMLFSELHASPARNSSE